MIDLTCTQCGAPYQRIPAKANGSKYCSRRCRVDATRNRATFECEQCGISFERPVHRANEARYCSRACKGIASRKPPKPPAPRKPQLAFTCIYCGNGFERPAWIVRQNGGRALYCSVTCRSTHRREALSGPNAPDWVGGPKTYRGRDWQRVRLEAVERDGGMCQECGKVVGDSIPVHHRKPFRDFATPKEANALENLVCLCQSCHMKIEYRPRRTVIVAEAE